MLCSISALARSGPGSVNPSPGGATSSSPAGMTGGTSSPLPLDDEPPTWTTGPGTMVSCVSGRSGPST
eukprot:4142053-Alexandrium_andersonii.AAC.1